MSDVTEIPQVDMPKLYRWREVPGSRELRPHCLPCNRRMGWCLEVNHDYPATLNKYTLRNGKHQVYYKGRMVQTWKCGGCGQTVVK